MNITIRNEFWAVYSYLYNTCRIITMLFRYLFCIVWNLILQIVLQIVLLSFTKTSLLEFRWIWIFLWIKLSWHSCSMWEKLGWLNWLWQFLCKWLSSINPKRFYHSYAYSYSLYERERPSFCTGLISRKLCRFLLTFSTGFTSLSVLLLFPLSITFFSFVHGFWFYFI